MHTTTDSYSALKCLILNSIDERTMKRNCINLVLRQPMRCLSQPKRRMACINFAINHSSICSSLAFSAFLGHSCCKMEACFSRQKINVLNSKPEFTCTEFSYGLNSETVKKFQVFVTKFKQYFLKMMTLILRP